MLTSSFFRFRRVALAVGALAFLILLPLPAHADDANDAEICGQALQRTFELVSIESTDGLTSELLDEINRNVSLLEACSDFGSHRWDWAPGVDQWAPLVAAYFRAEDVGRALCLMELESSGDPGARNPASGATGLMQIMPFWAGHFGYGSGALYNPEINVMVASQIRDLQGWSAWSPYLRGSCH